VKPSPYVSVFVMTSGRCYNSDRTFLASQRIGQPLMTRLHFRHRALLLAVVIAAAAAATSLSVVQADATPLSDKQAQAAQLEAQINANAVKLDALNEQVKAAQSQLDQANATIADADTRITAAKAQTDSLGKLVEERAASVYRSASNGTENNIFSIDISRLASSQKYASAATQHDNALVDQLNQAKGDLKAREKDAETAKQSAEAQKAALQAAESSFQATTGQYSALLGQVKGDLTGLVAQDAANRVAQQAPKGNGGGTSFDPSKIPPASGRGGIAVAFVQQQLGKPYCFAGSGPDCFDCSGLTMAAWAQAGVGLPHNSEAQIGGYPNVPMGALAGGDVVWTPGHVGLYVGGGAVIHAPHTGDVVRYIDVGYFERAMRPG
jgi:cell wall-associated NlpC family hydrolase